MWHCCHFLSCPALFLSFVSDVVNIYYDNDEVVQEDEEIQGFVKDACSFGMQDFDQCGGCSRRTAFASQFERILLLTRASNNKLERSDGVTAVAAAFLRFYSGQLRNVSSHRSGGSMGKKKQHTCRVTLSIVFPPPAEFPKSVKTREELTEYLTVIIFNASAQHAAVNFGQVSGRADMLRAELTTNSANILMGKRKKKKKKMISGVCLWRLVQYDWCSWIPNAPSTMRQAPPTKKGLADMRLILESLPDRGRSSWHLGAVWALSQYQDTEVVERERESGEAVNAFLHRYIFLKMKAQVVNPGVFFFGLLVF